jgi:hypothetical protein
MSGNGDIQIPSLALIDDHDRIDALRYVILFLSFTRPLLQLRRLFRVRVRVPYMLTHSRRWRTLSVLSLRNVHPGHFAVLVALSNELRFKFSRFVQQQRKPHISLPCVYLRVIASSIV